jgi:hypothetical protein
VSRNIELLEQARGPLRIWEHPLEDQSYVAGVDASQGVRGGDPSAIVVVRCDNLDQVALWKGFIDPRQLGRIAAWIGWHFNTAFLVPESNKDGQSVVFELKEVGYPSVYRTVSFDKVGGVEMQTKTLGFTTTLKTRPWLWNHMRLCINHGWGRISSRSQLEEMKQIRYDEKGTPIHPKGKHDDETIAWGLALVGRDQMFSTGVLDEPVQEPQTVMERHWAEFDREAEEGVEIPRDPLWD